VVLLHDGTRRGPKDKNAVRDHQRSFDPTFALAPSGWDEARTQTLIEKPRYAGIEPQRQSIADVLDVDADRFASRLLALT
jgi:hypothetical protein